MGGENSARTSFVRWKGQPMSRIELWHSSSKTSALPLCGYGSGSAYLLRRPGASFGRCPKSQLQTHAQIQQEERGWGRSSTGAQAACELEDRLALRKHTTASGPHQAKQSSILFPEFHQAAK